MVPVMCLWHVHAHFNIGGRGGPQCIAAGTALCFSASALQTLGLVSASVWRRSICGAMVHRQTSELPKALNCNASRNIKFQLKRRLLKKKQVGPIVLVRFPKSRCGTQRLNVRLKGHSFVVSCLDLVMSR